MDEVLFNEHGTKRVITLNRPKASNAITFKMTQRIYSNLKEYENGPNKVNLVIIKGAGNKAFCAGGDLYAYAVTMINRDYQRIIDDEIYYRLSYKIGTLRIPFVVILNGITMGGGAGLVIHGTTRVSTEATIFSLPEVHLGYQPDFGMANYVLPKLPGKVGHFLALTGSRLKGFDVFKMGISTHYVHSSLLPQLEKDLLSHDNIDQSDVDSMLDKFHQKSIPLQVQTGCLSSEELEKICKTFDCHSIENLISNLKNEGSDWSKKQLGILLAASPISLKITLKGLQRTDIHSLSKAFQIDNRVGKRLAIGHDMFEGVTTAMIRKDRFPKWNPEKLSDVTDIMVDSHFSPIPGHEFRLSSSHL